MNCGKKEVGPEQKKFFSRVGRVHLGSEPLDEATAAKLNKIIDDIDSGKEPGGIPEEWLLKDEQRKKQWEKMFGGKVKKHG